MDRDTAGSKDQHIFAIGDIHGRLDRLDPLLGRLMSLDPAARLIFIGDYLDRGGQSRQVIDRLIQVRLDRPDTVFLMGNHEAALLRYAETKDTEDLRSLRGMGFQATLDSYGASPGEKGLGFMPKEHRQFLHGLELWFRSPGYVFFHAPVAYGIDPTTVDSNSLEGLLSNRTVDAPGWEESGETLVFGHMPLETPLMAPGLIGIDTGTGHGGLLTALELPALRFHHA